MRSIVQFLTVLIILFFSGNLSGLMAQSNRHNTHCEPKIRRSENQCYQNRVYKGEMRERRRYEKERQLRRKNNKLHFHADVRRDTTRINSMPGRKK